MCWFGWKYCGGNDGICDGCEYGVEGDCVLYGWGDWGDVSSNSSVKKSDFET